MKPAEAAAPPLIARYHQALRVIVRLLAILAGAGLMVMVLVTTTDVVLRAARLSKAGAYDIVKIVAAVTLAAALPYTTAVKGHVAIEYFFHKLGRHGRIAVDTAMRLTVMALFTVLAWGSLRYGRSLWQSQEVSLTLQWPIFWVPWVIAFSCVLVVLITLYHLTHPGKEFMKP
jgi:TRAP-type C4-dicarboxylate transport system permease small subunit